MAASGALIEVGKKPTTSAWMTIRGSTLHGKGGFATQDIPKGTRIIEYVGHRLTKKQSLDRQNETIEEHEEDPTLGAVYVFELNSRHDIDGSPLWNSARWINHSCEPNCEVEIGRGHIWIVAKGDIARGDELAYNYGYDWKDSPDHPCLCGTRSCPGYICAEEDWPKLKRHLKKKRQRKLQKKRARRR